jgi:ribosome recycling factor
MTKLPKLTRERRLEIVIDLVNRIEKLEAAVQAFAQTLKSQPPVEKKP